MSDFQEKILIKGLLFNVISVTRGLVGVKIPRKKHYVTVEWLLCVAECCCVVQTT